MRVNLNWKEIGMSAEVGRSGRQGISKALVASAAGGDFQSCEELVRCFMPVLQDLSKRRTNGVQQRNVLIDAGKRGLLQAARRYQARGAAKKDFKLFALPYIEKGMNVAEGKAGWWTRLWWR